MVNLTMVIVCCYSLSSVASPLDALTGFGEWLGIGWDEELGSIDPEELPEWVIDINRVEITELASIPGMDFETARRIVSERRESGVYKSDQDLLSRVKLSPGVISTLLSRLKVFKESESQVRARIRASRRFGINDDANAERYDGNPIGLTEQVFFTHNDFQAGILLDKDRYESALNDLERFSLQYSQPSLGFTAGDFHVSALRGVTLRTRQTYAVDLGSPAAYSWKEKTITPAIDTQQNRALRGLAADFRKSSLHGLIFVSRTDLDAIVDDAGKVLRLSTGGLHRTPGEELKKNSVRESGVGGLIEFERQVRGSAKARIGICGYAMEYAPSFDPAPDPRAPYPISGAQIINLGIGGGIETGSLSLGWEAGSDLNSPPRRIAGRIDFSGIVGKTNRSLLSVTLYHFPPDWNNPRGGSLTGSSAPSNREGGALTMSRRYKHDFFRRWQAHFELERRKGRSYTLPLPSRSSKAVVEAELAALGGRRVLVRLRRKVGLDGAGNEGPVASFTDERARLTLYTGSYSRVPVRFRAWVEIARLNRDQTGNAVEMIEGREGYGGMSGLKATLAPFQNGTLFDALRFHITLTYFASANGLPLYLGEGELPDALSSIRLSGVGVRWSAVVVYRRGRYGWLGIKAARTESVAAGGDLELNMTASLLLHK